MVVKRVKSAGMVYLVNMIVGVAGVTDVFKYSF